MIVILKNMFFFSVKCRDMGKLLDCSNTHDKNINAIICKAKHWAAKDMIRLKFPTDHKKPSDVHVLLSQIYRILTAILS